MFVLLFSLLFFLLAVLDAATGHPADAALDLIYVILLLLVDDRIRRDAKPG